MSNQTDQIRTILDHEHFDNINEFSEIADEENYTRENDGITLNEAIVDFEMISEVIETAIEEGIFDDLSNNHENAIKDRLTNVRKQASNIENRNSRRNNPGQDFINHVDKLKSFVFGNLSLDLRVSEYLDLSKQLSELKEIREEQQETIHNLEKAEDTYAEIDQFYEEIEDDKATIDDIISSVKKSQSELEQIKTNASTTQQDIENEAQTVNERYEEVLKKTEKINDYEDRLENSLSEIEQRSERIDAQQDDIQDLNDKISNLLSGAIAASLDQNFSEQKEELEDSAQFWARATFVAIGALFVFAVIIFRDITQISDLGVGTISRVTLLIPPLIGVWFTSKNYSQKRKLMDEYAFKATIAQTLEPSRDVLEAQLTTEGSDKQLAEFMVVSMGQIFRNPSEILNNSDSTDDDATHVETVMDLSRDIIGENSD